MESPFEPEIQVPSSDADWYPTIVEFALTWNGYDRFGPIGNLAAAANGAVEEWKTSGALPPDLALLRSFLFFEQRRWRHLEAHPEGEDRAYVEALLDLIRDLSGGAVPGPADPSP